MNKIWIEESNIEGYQWLCGLCEPIRFGSKIFLSKQKFDELKQEVPKQFDSLSTIVGIQIYPSPLFPFEIMYDACDIESKMKVKIPSGEWVHGAFIPEIPTIDTRPLL